MRTPLFNLTLLWPIGGGWWYILPMAITDQLALNRACHLIYKAQTAQQGAGFEILGYDQPRLNAPLNETLSMAISLLKAAVERYNSNSKAIGVKSFPVTILAADRREITSIFIKLPISTPQFPIYALDAELRNACKNESSRGY